MHRVKYETNTTGTATALTLSVVPGFEGMATSANSPFHPYDTTGACIYYLIDGNGTAWECGYGTISGSTLTRPSNDVYYSTDGAGGPGYYDTISLSATTPHTVIITRGFYEGAVLTSKYSGTTGSFSTSTAEVTSFSSDFDGLIYLLDGKANGSATVVCGDPRNEVKIARGYRITVVAECDTASSGNFFGVGVRLDDTVPELVQNYAPLLGSNTLCSVTTPIIGNVPPFSDSSTSHCINDYGSVDYWVYNPGTQTITVNLEVFIEWYL